MQPSHDPEPFDPAAEPQWLMDLRDDLRQAPPAAPALERRAWLDRWFGFSRGGDVAASPAAPSDRSAGR